jgi:hypothetical protein
MAMRSCGTYAWCDECQTLFASGPNDERGSITHPTWNQYPDMHPISVELYRACPNAGRTFKHPVMEEVK